MSDKQEYLKSLKKEIEEYTKKLYSIQEEFKGKTGENIEIINRSFQDILHEAVVAYGKLESASEAEWEPVKAITNEAFKNLRESFQEKINASVSQIKEYRDQLEESSQEHLEGVAKYVRKHPFKSLLWAAGVGFIIGKILK